MSVRSLTPHLSMRSPPKSRRFTGEAPCSFKQNARIFFQKESVGNSFPVSTQGPQSLSEYAFFDLYTPPRLLLKGMRESTGPGTSVHVKKAGNQLLPFAHGTGSLSEVRECPWPTRAPQPSVRKCSVREGILGFLLGYHSSFLVSCGIQARQCVALAARDFLLLKQYAFFWRHWHLFFAVQATLFIGATAELGRLSFVSLLYFRNTEKEAGV